jgi:hypothetical protein
MSMDDKHKSNFDDRLAIVFRGPNGIKPGVAFAPDSLDDIKTAFRECGWSIYSGPELESFAREIESLVSTEIGQSSRMFFRSPKGTYIEFTADSFTDDVRRSFAEHGWKEEELSEIAP